MNKSAFRFIVLLSSVLLLSSCFTPKTPQEVAQAFWQAVLHNDVKDAVSYSTLTDPKYYDGFAKDWSGYHARWGRVVIDGNSASIVSEFSSPANSGQDDRKFITYLVKRGEAWKVDYDHTKQAVHGGVLGSLIDQIGQLGDDLSKQMNSSADDFKHEMDRMSKQLEQMANTFGEEASKNIDKYAQQLRQSIQELEDSINRALKNDKDLSEHDRQVLQVAASNLNQDHKKLDEPSTEAVSQCSQNIGKTQQQLETVNSDSVEHYKSEWRDLTRKIERDMRKLLDNLAASQNH
jgi:membrane-associated HD superfamily phosphohydrolase